MLMSGSLNKYKQSSNGVIRNSIDKGFWDQSFLALTFHLMFNFYLYLF